VARLGGDEFAVAVALFPAPRTDAPAIPGTAIAGLDPEPLARALLAEIETPVAYDGRQLRVSASLGISMTGAGRDTVVDLCRAADQAMFQAKLPTSAQICLFDPRTIPHRPTLQDRQRLSAAIASREITVHYQPKVYLASGEICGLEALARWQHPDRGLLGPDAFLPQIDELGLQGDFLSAMVAQVLTDLTDLLAEGHDIGQVSVNVPEVTLATLTGRAELDRLLDIFPAALPHLTFEITEDVFITRSGTIIQASITHFRNRGVRISLDDFGTGFASFQHLRELEFDELKIDRSFVEGLGEDTAAEVLVDGFLTIAQGLGVTVVAEGVETEDHRRRLMSLGATVAQGWLFARAQPIAEIRAAMERAAETGDGCRAVPSGTVVRSATG